MKHLTDEELVELYYKQGGRETAAHVVECGACAAALAAIEKDLSPLKENVIPEPDAHYEERMWARVEAALPPRPAQRGAWRLGLWRSLAYGTGCAVIAAGGFYGGMAWEKLHPQRANQANNAPAPRPATAPPQQQQVVIVVLGDHLDRSERLLVELKHADPDAPELVSPLKDEARSLLAANSVFRDDAERAGDASLSEALSRLEKLLTELAAGPEGLSAASIARLQKQMQDDGVLFQVRVLRSKDPHRNTAIRLVARGGSA